MKQSEIKQRARDLACLFVEGAPITVVNAIMATDAPAAVAVAVYVQLQNKRGMPKGLGRADFARYMAENAALYADGVER